MYISQNISIDNMFSNLPDLLTAEDLQIALGVGRSMAYRLISNGSIKHLRIGKNIRIPKQFLVDYIVDSCYNNDSSKSAVSKKGVTKNDGNSEHI